MRRAERMIRIKIDEMNLERYPYKKKYIVDAIEFSYLAGTISKRKMNKLTKLLMNKCDKLMNEYNMQAVKQSDEAYKRIVKQYNKEN